MIEETKKTTNVIQNIILENREKINKLNLDTAEVVLDGLVSSLTYSNADAMKKNATGFISKIFK